jgi:nicotinate phosphoribosyltransferase
MQHLTITGTYTDLYQLTMGQVYFLQGSSRHEAVFDYFFRKLPFNGGYVVFAGLDTLLTTLQDLRFTPEDLEYLRKIGLNEDFLTHLKDFRFEGTIYAVKEGEIVFPNQPVVRVQGTMLEAQIVETLLLNILNYQSLVATRAARIRWVAPDRVLSDFGLRRAQGMGGYHAARAAMVGGFDSTSNVKAGLDFGIPTVGTMAHAFIESYEDELTAFRDFAAKRSSACVLLVDTYDTLRSGIPNAITVAKEMETRGQQLAGIRLDSGDLAYLSTRARQMLDDAGLHYVKITASNQLDEYVVKSLLDQGAPIDVFGVGTSLVTCPPDAALDGVYKVSFANGKPRIKLSENIAKITLPGEKQVHRLTNGNNFFTGDVVCLADEKNIEWMHHPSEPEKQMSLNGMKPEVLLQPCMRNGSMLAPSPSLKEISSYCRSRLAAVPDEHKRFQNPHIYKVGISQKLRDLRDKLKQEHKK